MLGSYTIEEIVNRAKQAFEEGVVEIWLTSEDTGAWGRDLGLTLPDLLEKLVTAIFTKSKFSTKSSFCRAKEPQIGNGNFFFKKSTKLVSTKSVHHCL